MTFDFEKGLKSSLENFTLKDSELSQAIAYSLLSPGKRLRPQMVKASADMFGLSNEITEPLSLALEMIHCFTLIHDDLPCMDNDDFRRGIPTCHKKFNEPIALLAGDGLIPLAYQTCLRISPYIATDHMVRVLSYFSECIGCRGVLEGQAEEFLLKKTPSLPALIRVFELKTGALFQAALLLPALAAGAEEKSLDHLKKAGSDFGIAFQIADDLEEPLQKSEISILHYHSFLDSQKLALTYLKSSLENLKNAFFLQLKEKELNVFFTNLSTHLENKINLCKE